MIGAAERRALEVLELTVVHRLDGILHGDYRGLIPGHGEERGEARVYEPGDDVRHIDWNVTARTCRPHVRDTIADRELETTLVVDKTPSMSFGTAAMEKRELATAAASAIGYLVQRGGNRVGAVVTGGSAIPHRSGRRHLQHILASVYVPPAGEDGSLVEALGDAARITRHRGLVVVISDFLDPGEWERPLRVLAARHEVLALEIVDPRELDLPDVGPLTMVDVETGRRRWVDTRSASFRSAFRDAAASQRHDIRHQITGTGAHHLRLRTDHDWVREIVRYVQVRRRGHTTGRRM